MNGVIRLKNTSFLVINSTVSVGGKITKKRERTERTEEAWR